MIPVKRVPISLLDDTDFRFADHFCYRSTLGKGSFGCVVLAVSKETLETMAVKVFFLLFQDYREITCEQYKN